MNQLGSHDQEEQKVTNKEFFYTIKKKALLILLTASALVTGVSVSYLAGATSKALPYVEQMLSPTIVTIVTLVSHVVGSFACGFVIEKEGARTAVLLSYVLLIVGPIIMSAAPGSFIIGSFIIGLGKVTVELGVSMINFSTSNFLAELSPARVRGKMITLSSDGISLGHILSSAVHILFIKAENPWRYMILFAIIPPIIQIFLLRNIPDSPLWNLTMGYIEDSLVVLEKTHTEEEAIKEYHALQKCVQEANSKEGQSFFGRCKYMLFDDMLLRKAVFAAVSVQIVQQVAGIQTVLYYSKIVPSKKFRGVAIYDILESLGSFINFFLIDKYGRRSLLTLSLSICSVSLTLLSAIFFFEASNTIYALIIVCLYISSYSIFFGAVPLVLNTELFPPMYRGAGASLSTFSKWVISTVVTTSFKPLQKLLGSWGILLFYAVFSFLGLILVRVILPEMKAVSIANIHANLSGHSNLRHVLPTTSNERPSEPPCGDAVVCLCLENGTSKVEHPQETSTARRGDEKKVESVQEQVLPKTSNERPSEPPCEDAVVCLCLENGTSKVEHPQETSTARGGDEKKVESVQEQVLPKTSNERPSEPPCEDAVVCLCLENGTSKVEHPQETSTARGGDEKKVESVQEQVQEQQH